MQKIGIVGTGYIASGIYQQMKPEKAFVVSKMLTRRTIDSSIGLPQSILTNSAEAMVEDCDLIVEASVMRSTLRKSCLRPSKPVNQSLP